MRTRADKSYGKCLGFTAQVVVERVETRQVDALSNPEFEGRSPLFKSQPAGTQVNRLSPFVLILIFLSPVISK